MVTQQLLDYIKAQLQSGKAKEQITQELINGGWQAQDVEQGFISLNSGTVPPPITEIPKARQIFNESWEIYKNRFQTLIAINLIPVGGIFILGILGLIFGFTSQSLPQLLTSPSFIVALVVGLILILGLIYIGLWSTVAELVAIKDQAEGIGFQEAFKRSQVKIGAFFVISFLTGLAVFGGLLLLIIPGIIFALWFSQAPYIYIEQGIEGTDALKKSKYYVKGRTGQIFGKMFYIGIITFALNILVWIGIGIITTMAKIQPQYISWLNNVFSLIWTPLVTVYCYQLYKYVKASRP